MALRGRNYRRNRNRLSLESLESRLALAGRPVISEFLAANDNDLTDGDGASSDWIEIYNAGDEAIDLGGWFLTNNASELPKWAFPSVSLPAAEHLVVFASGRAGGPFDSQGHLHANFRLNREGGFLALVRPDGHTIASVPGATGNYPEQFEDVSYGEGISVSTTPLIVPAASAMILQPTTELQLPANWQSPDLEASLEEEWSPATAGFGFAAQTQYDLVAYWPLDDGAGQAITDYSGNGRHGHLGATVEPGTNDPSWEFADADSNRTRAGHVLSFDGDDWVELSEHIAAVGELYQGTLSAWVRIPPGTPTAGEPGAIVAASDPADAASDLRLAHDPATGRVRFDVRDNGDDEYPAVAPAVDLRDGFWHHVAVTVDEDGATDIYVDGAAAAHGVEAGFFNAVGNLARLSLGRNVDDKGGEQFFHGQMSEVAIWGEPLPTDQIALLADGVSPLSLHTFHDLAATRLDPETIAANPSVYQRTRFTVADFGSHETLFLNARYDDGFVAWLNGVEVARRNAPANVPWNSSATLSRNDAAALTVERINLTEFIGLLRPGENANVLAVQVLGSSADDIDLLWLPELVIADVVSLGPRFFSPTSPHRLNELGFFGLIETPQASVSRGFFDAPFTVSLHTETPEATIHYTTDGSEPTPSRPAYTGPITISRTTVLRAAAFRTGFAPSAVATNSYLFTADVARQDGSDLPAGPDYSVNPAIATDALAAAAVRSSLQSLPTLSLSLDVADIFGPSGIFTNSTRHGDEWERGASAEWIESNGETAFQIDAGLRMHGGASRTNSPKRSFRLHFRETWGPEKLEYPLFGAEAAAAFDVLVLRGGYNDIWTSNVSSPASDISNVNAQYIRDEWSRQSQTALGHLAPHGTWAHLYINGLYWGLYNVAERADENFAASYYGGDESDYDVVGHNLSPGGVRVVTGDSAAWDAMAALLADNTASNAIYAAVSQFLDVDNFIDYMILNLYTGNRDWPHNNWYASRPRTPGGQFRFYAWDGEMGLGFLDESRRLETAAERSPGYIYDRLRENAEFRQRFADRVLLAMGEGGPLSPASAAARYQAIAETIEPALVAEAARWGDARHAPPLDVDDWRAVIQQKLTSYFPARTDIVLDQFRSIGLYSEVATPEIDSPSEILPHAAPAILNLPADASPLTNIYFTIDGSDPRQPGSQEILSLVTSATPRRYFVPSPLGGDVNNAWRGGAAFDDAAWSATTGGIGYDDTAGPISASGAIIADVGEAMRGVSTSALVRIPFSYGGSSADAERQLSLRVRYDDGFAAFLNGVQLAAVAAPGDLDETDSATSYRSDASAALWQAFDVTAALGALRSGENILALHGLNRAANDGTFLVEAELVLTATLPAIPAPEADRYEGPRTLLESTTIRARSFDGFEWSPIVTVDYKVASPVRVTEIMYRPVSPTPLEIAAGFTSTADFEFIEIANTGLTPVDVEGLRFTSGVEWSATTTVLLPGEHAVVARNPAALALRYGDAVRIVGQFDGELSDVGERVTLLAHDDEILADLRYDDAAPWPASEVAGRSLVPIVETSPWATTATPAAWRATYRPGGSPGARDLLPGDIDGDGSATLRDLIALRNQFGSVQPGSNADVNSDGLVDAADVVFVLRGLGTVDADANRPSPLDRLAPPSAPPMVAAPRISAASPAAVTATASRRLAHRTTPPTELAVDAAIEDESLTASRRRTRAWRL